MAASTIQVFGVPMPSGTTPLTALLWSILDRNGKGNPAWEVKYDDEEWLSSLSDADYFGLDGRPSKLSMFWRIVDILWNSDGQIRVVRNEWTDRMFEAMLNNNFIALAGCASSGKSVSAAVFALVMFLAAPTETLIFITSTSIKGAKQRVWKTIAELWNALSPEYKDGIGDMVDSKAMIRGYDENGVGDL